MSPNAIYRAVAILALGLTGSIVTGNSVGSETAAPKVNAPAASGPAVYVDSKLGRDANPGTEESPVHSIAKAAQIIRSRDNAIYVMRLKAGIYDLDKPVALATEKDMAGQRIVVEAATLPGDPAWTPEKMPIVINSSNLGDSSADASSFVVSLLIDESHVTVRGIKFHGYSRPNSRYFPIARFNKVKTDLRVEQCMFIGDAQAAHLQVGVIAHGNGVKIDHCVFYYANNAVVFWEDAGDGLKSGNELTHSIIVGAGQSAVWTAWPDKDFLFRNNIVTGCKHVWIRNADNPSQYAMENCISVGNQHPMAVAHNDGVRPESFALRESNVVKSGEITLRLVDDLDQPLPRDYLHTLPGTTGHDLHAGLFKE